MCCYVSSFFFQHFFKIIPCVYPGDTLFPERKRLVEHFVLYFIEQRNNMPCQAIYRCALFLSCIPPCDFGYIVLNISRANGYTNRNSLQLILRKFPARALVV